MTLYERIETLRKMEKISQGKLETELGFSNGSISKWKNSTPTMERLNVLANHFGVSVDFLFGNTDTVTCPECGFVFMPLSEQSIAEHNAHHNRFTEIKGKYPFFIEFSLAEKQKTDSIFGFRNPQFSLEEKLAYYEKYLQAAFSLHIIDNHYDYENMDYEEFCRAEVKNMTIDSLISKEFIDALSDKYGVVCCNIEYEISTKQLDNIGQLKRIMEYAKRLSPDVLNSLEIQIKALAEQDKGGK
ncbi:MAG: helix-turn-helix domain-containing protein [Roseburia sp.]|nr:helix-turn-helix domain-containing protein [Roseburia sp.]